MVCQSWGPPRNYRRSVAYITATHGGWFEELFSRRSGVFFGLESTTIREVSGTEETEPPQVRSAVKPAARAFSVALSTPVVSR
jgi:hypothetical protein